MPIVRAGSYRVYPGSGLPRMHVRTLPLEAASFCTRCGLPFEATSRRVVTLCVDFAGLLPRHST